MAVVYPQFSTNDLIFNSFNPFIEGLKQGGAIGNQALQSALNGLNIKQKSEQLKYLPQILQQKLQAGQLANQMSQAELQYKPQLLASQLQHILLSNKKMSQPEFASPIGKAMQDYNTIKSMYGEEDPRTQAAKAYLGQISAGKQGISLSTNPDGSFNFNMGGVSDVNKNPMFGSQKSGAGGTYQIRDENGNIRTVSTPTNAVSAFNQRAIGSIDKIQPMIEDMTKQLPQFQSPKTKALEKLQGYSNTFLGTDYRLPSVKAAGIQNLKMSTEGLIRAAGLQPTVEALKMMNEAIEPQPGESANGYKNRLVNTLKNIKKEQEQFKEAQRVGYDVSGENSSNDMGMGKFTDEDIMHTAKKYNMTPEQVKAKLAAKMSNQ